MALFLTVVITLFTLLSSATAATRLGLHVTAEELAIWRTRMTDTVGTMNGVTFQSMYTTRILNEANAFRSQSHPGGDGFWAGYTGSGCVPNTSSTAPNPGSGGTPYGRGNGAYLARSAFVYLLTGDVSYATPVRLELLNQITQAGTNFSNTAKWCPDGLGSQNAIETVPWVYRLLMAYDYLMAGGYTGFSASEKSNILNWFGSAADLWDYGQHRAVSLNGYKGVYNIPQDLTCTGSACTTVGALLYFGGPSIRTTHNLYNNVGAITPMLSMAYGLLTNNATHIQNAKAWITALLKIGIWDNGSFQDFTRWRDCTPTCPGSVWSHAGGMWGPITAAIDMLARSGDTSLYTLSGPTQVIGGSGGTVSWQTSVELAARMINKTTLLYGTTSAGSVGPATLLSWDTGWDGEGAYHDFPLMMANLFYQNPTVTTAMQRTIIGCLERQFGGCTAAVWAFWADMPFMAGKLQGVVNPYTFSAPAPDYTSGLRMHLPFDEGADTTAQDATVNNHDGTLGAGASWGAAQLGANALALDGTAAGVVTVTGGLTNPTSATLAAWVFPTAWPTGNNDVLNLRNAIVLRLTGSNGSVRGSFYTGTGYSGITVTAGLALNTWHHIAYTVVPGTQKVYVNGALVGSGSSGSPVTYTGLPANTLIGGHPTDPTNYPFQGRIDDVRVYTRALSATDIAGLAVLEDPPPLSIQITAPTTNPSYSTASALLANLGGVARDDIGVTGITWNCPTCVTTSGSATCTPACGASATDVNWSVPEITLTPGSNLITVTATDASGPISDTLTVTYTVPPVAGACTHYASQEGGGSGLAEGSPFRVVDFLGAAAAGQTLCLLDGTYTGGNSMLVPPSGASGTTSLPITVRALHDGMALLDGQYARNPVVLSSANQWWVVQGLNARNGLTAVYQFLGANTLGQRLIGWQDTGGAGIASVFTLLGAGAVVEDSAGWGAQVQTIFLGSGTISSPGGGCRRCWCEWKSLPPNSSTPGACYIPGKDQRFENVLGTLRETGP